jgi:predicted nucleic acid-binding Zn ribbon protein
MRVQAPKLDKRARKGPVIPAPPDLAALFQLVKLLPHSERRSEAKGIHELTMREWSHDDETKTYREGHYLWRHVDKLPLSLQAFVWRDEVGQFADASGMELAHADYFQLHRNIELTGQPEGVLREVISRGKERIDLEIERVEDRNTPREPAKSKDHSISEVDLLGALELKLLKQYLIGDLRFMEVGPSWLLVRARQRFFFILAAEEILHALTTVDPQRQLDDLWYTEESGAGFSGHLVIEADHIGYSTPLLISCFLGVQVSRIRKCTVCMNYFWAGRKDKSVCSTQCGANKRKRRERARYMEVKLGDHIPQKRIKDKPPIEGSGATKRPAKRRPRKKGN